uniref:Ependymin n=1 Tax=Monopterus albus TaxID=43700 RepID=A0A3Q3R8L6_MONAL
MYAAVTLLVFMCLAVTTHAGHHMNLKGEWKGGAFTYDSMGKKLRFISNDSFPVNTSLGLDLLMFFDEGIFYEIDNTNQSCEKKALNCTMHPLDIPDDATLSSTLNFGRPFTEGEGLTLNKWTGSMPGMKGHYAIYATRGCVPVNMYYFTESTSFVFSTIDVELEIKNHDLLMVPSFCKGQPVEQTPEGTVNSFLNEFM